MDMTKTITRLKEAQREMKQLQCRAEARQTLDARADSPRLA
jgi:hypothetical protein